MFHLHFGFVRVVVPSFFPSIGTLNFTSFIHLPSWQKGLLICHGLEILSLHTLVLTLYSLPTLAFVFMTSIACTSIPSPNEPNTGSPLYHLSWILPKPPIISSLSIRLKQKLYNSRSSCKTTCPQKVSKNSSTNSTHRNLVEFQIIPQGVSSPLGVKVDIFNHFHLSFNCIFMYQWSTF